MPSTEPIIALFDDAAQARHLRDELRRAGISPREMTLVEASPEKDRSRVVDRLIDAGIPKADAALFADEVCGGAILLAVCPTAAERARVAEIIGRHAPTRRMATAASGEPKSGDASAEGARSCRCRQARARSARGPCHQMTKIGRLPGSVAFFRYASEQCRIPGVPSCIEPL